MNYQLVARHYQVDSLTDWHINKWMLITSGYKLDKRTDFKRLRKFSGFFFSISPRLTGAHQISELANRCFADGKIRLSYRLPNDLQLVLAIISGDLRNRMTLWNFSCSLGFLHFLSDSDETFKLKVILLRSFFCFPFLPNHSPYGYC